MKPNLIQDRALGYDSEPHFADTMEGLDNIPIETTFKVTVAQHVVGAMIHHLVHTEHAEVLTVLQADKDKNLGLENPLEILARRIYDVRETDLELEPKGTRRAMVEQCEKRYQEQLDFAEKRIQEIVKAAGAVSGNGMAYTTDAVELVKRLRTSFEERHEQINAFEEGLTGVRAALTQELVVGPKPDRGHDETLQIMRDELAVITGLLGEEAS